jgi:hypothetical protein
MNSSIQDAHNLAWKLARVCHEPDADVDALLNSYAEERWGYVDREVQPTTDMIERFESGPTFLRASIVWLGDKLLGAGKSAPAVARRVSMLDVAYGRSALLASEAPVGLRIPDVIGGDGHRLLGNRWNAFVVHAACQESGRQLASSLKLPLVDGDVARLVKFFDRDRFVAVIRPDRIVGWVGDGDEIDVRVCATALGIRSRTPEIRLSGANFP